VDGDASHGGLAYTAGVISPWKPRIARGNDEKQEGSGGYDPRQLPLLPPDQMNIYLRFLDVFGGQKVVGSL
jgi:hypothetical protein